MLIICLHLDFVRVLFDTQRVLHGCLDLLESREDAVCESELEIDPYLQKKYVSLQYGAYYAVNRTLLEPDF